MYRSVVAFLLCHSVTGAPQALSDSDITYVKQQPPSEVPPAPFHRRESRIENLPLTIPGIPRHEPQHPEKPTEANLDSDNDLSDSETLVAERSELSETIVLPDSFPEPDLPTNSDSVEPSNKTDLSRVSEVTTADVAASHEIETEDEKTVPSDVISPGRSDLTDEQLEPRDDTFIAESSQSERRGRTYESAETTDIFEEATEIYDNTEEPRTRATPRFIPKLSYPPKQKSFVSYPTNAIERAGKRRFRSNCRCEKIWNCNKLQITVGRCPDEYFLCCF